MLNNHSNQKGNNFINLVFSDPDLQSKFSEYPFNLLPELVGLNNLTLFFLIIILNISFAEYLSKLNYEKYIPNNKLGLFLKKVLNRYLIIWSKSSKWLKRISFFMLIYCTCMIKLGLYCIFNN
uniref:Hyp18 n=1 Tax=Moniliophthora roreri (strain MCA 2997) TaxID=1381753 RepID=F2WVK9_MONRO|nr:hyp18 [Moniliophthora roreri]ADO51601.1 hyp18 [Moniliophthora roreri]